MIKKLFCALFIVVHSFSLNIRSNKIHIMYVCTDATAPFVAASMASLADISGETENLRVYIVGISLSNNTKQKLLDLGHKLPLALEFFDSPLSMEPEAVKAQYSRTLELAKFHIPHALKRLDKILVLSPHTIILRPVGGLYNMDCRTAPIRALKYGTVNDRDESFSTAVMLINPVLINQNMLNETASFLGKSSKYNGNCRLPSKIFGQILNLSLAYNMDPEEIYADESRLIEKHPWIEPSQITLSRKEPFILYFPYKSYTYLDHAYSHLFLAYLSRVPWKWAVSDIINKHKHDFEEMLKKQDFNPEVETDAEPSEQMSKVW